MTERIKLFIETRGAAMAERPPRPFLRSVEAVYRTHPGANARTVVIERVFAVPPASHVGVRFDDAETWFTTPERPAGMHRTIDDAMVTLLSYYPEALPATNVLAQ